jgi:hypothetical protein
MAKATTSTNSKGELIVTIGSDKYNFRHPKGKDLAIIERAMKVETSTDSENLAVVMSTLSDLPADDYLELPIGTFKAVGEKVMEYFRVASATE